VYNEKASSKDAKWVEEPTTKKGCFIKEATLREKATAGFEPAIRVLQTPALPLGYVAM
jgi:hypothetical protein